MDKVIFIILVLVASQAIAQYDQSLLIKGNELYKNKQYDKAADQYQKAAEVNEKDPKAQYNLGNALYRSKKTAPAQKAFDAAAESAKEPAIKSRALYNKGVTYSSEKKLFESIDAYKKTLILNPEDEEARENLQKALNELKKQPPQKQNQKNQDQKNNDNQKNPSPQNKSKLNQKQAEKMLNALRQEEKRLQQNKQKKANTGGMQEKDW